MPLIKIALVAPSWDVKPEVIERSKRNLTQFFAKNGIEVLFEDFLPGSDFYNNDVVFDTEIVDGEVVRKFNQEKFQHYQLPHIPIRAQKIKEALESDFHIIWAVSGGTGATEVIKLFKREGSISINSKKYFMGFSDTTAFHNWFIENYPEYIRSIQSPDFQEFASQSLESLIMPIFLSKMLEIFNSTEGEVIQEYDLTKLNNVDVDTEIKAKSIGGSSLMFIDEAHIRRYVRPIPYIYPELPMEWKKEIVDDKVVFLEPSNINYSIETLNKYSDFFNKSKAIILGGFGIKNLEILDKLTPFLMVMEEKGIPVYQMKNENFGHHTYNKDGISNFVPIALDCDTSIIDNKLKIAVPNILSPSVVAGNVMYVRNISEGSSNAIAPQEHR